MYIGIPFTYSLALEATPTCSDKLQLLQVERHLLQWLSTVSHQTKPSQNKPSIVDVHQTID